MENKKSKLSRLVEQLPDLLRRAEDYNEDCLSCNGRGITYRKIDVYAPCINCNSTGRVPFVDNIIPKNNPPDLDVMHQIAERNVHILTRYIREEYAKIGVEIDIRINFLSRSWEQRNSINPPYMKDIYPADGNLEEKLMLEPLGREKKCFL
jgi:hypothetical protein